jgi:hypothetical protein
LSSFDLDSRLRRCSVSRSWSSELLHVEASAPLRADSSRRAVHALLVERRFERSVPHARLEVGSPARAP